MNVHDWKNVNFYIFMSHCCVRMRPFMCAFALRFLLFLLALSSHVFRDVIVHPLTCLDESVRPFQRVIWVGGWVFMALRDASLISANIPKPPERVKFDGWGKNPRDASATRVTLFGYLPDAKVQGCK